MKQINLYKIYKSIFITLFVCVWSISGNADRLTGVVTGSDLNQAQNCFDGDYATSFVGDNVSDSGYVRNWAGLALDAKHVITRVGILPSVGHENDCRFAVVQGANNSDYSDAMTIMVYKDELVADKMNYLDITTSRGFQFLRVVATDSDGRFAEIEFEGTEGEGDDSQFYQMTNLPLVSFVTPGMSEIVSKDDKHPGSYVTIVSDGGKNLLEDKKAQMKGRGNGSWTFPKKPFQIKFDKKQRPLDATAKAKKWTLINNYGDRSLMRNMIAFEMSRLAGMEYTPYCAFVDVIYNGEYMGCYQLCDQVEAKEGRVEITEMSPDDKDGEALSGGYFIEIDGYAQYEESWFTSDRGVRVTIKSPDEDEIVPEQTDYISGWFNTMESALFSPDFMDESAGYRRYLDLDSFLRYFIVSELDGNTDAFWSVYMRKERGDDRFYVGPVWDIDLGFQNTGEPYPVNDMTDFLYTSPGATVIRGMKGFIDRIIKEDVLAKSRMKDIWADLRKNCDYNYDYFESKIDAWAEDLEESQRLNFTRWPILNLSVQKDQKIFGSYEGEIENIKSYLKDRFPKLDGLFGMTDNSIEIIEDKDIQNADIEYYNLSGVRVAPGDLLPGVYIRKAGNKVTKVMAGRL
ncbi:MAG: CotH kinase family protein [Muribaculaceae bacterium]|nr:CotH kinase family protein [Muribaculaceae bacterium]